MLSSNGIGNSQSKVAFGNNTAIDAFGRMRVSEPAYRFDSQLTYQIDSDLWDTRASGVGSAVSYDSTNRMAVLSGAASSGSIAVMQSHYCPPYTPGRSHLGFVTYNLGTGTGILPTGVQKRVGMYDEINNVGLYLQQDVSGVSMNLVGGTSYAAQKVYQPQWNLDRFDGTGPSRFSLDHSKVQILGINYQALYVGRAVMGFDIDGEFLPAHQFLHANNISFPYIKDANLPIHYSVRTNVATGVSMNAICASVISEGGDEISDIEGRSFSVGNGVTSIGVTTRRPILSIQASGQLNSINSNTLLVLTDIDFLARTNDAYVEIIRNGTLTGPAYTPVNSLESSTVYDISANAIAGGTTIHSFYAPATANTRVAVNKAMGGKIILNYSHLIGSGDRLSVVVTSRNATSDCHAGLSWKEIR
jgi:hypothetical protein